MSPSSVSSPTDRLRRGWKRNLARRTTAALLRSSGGWSGRSLPRPSLSLAGSTPQPPPAANRNNPRQKTNERKRRNLENTHVGRSHARPALNGPAATLNQKSTRNITFIAPNPPFKTDLMTVTALTSRSSNSPARRSADWRSFVLEM